jgi:hypothetical protein
MTGRFDDCLLQLIDRWRNYISPDPNIAQFIFLRVSDMALLLVMITSAFGKTKSCLIVAS